MYFNDVGDVITMTSLCHHYDLVRLLCISDRYLVLACNKFEIGAPSIFRWDPYLVVTITVEFMLSRLLSSLDKIKSNYQENS